MFQLQAWLALALLSGLTSLVGATELTFELLQHDKQCFYEEIEAGMESTLEFQASLKSSILFSKRHCWRCARPLFAANRFLPRVFATWSARCRGCGLLLAHTSPIPQLFLLVPPEVFEFLNGRCIIECVPQCVVATTSRAHRPKPERQPRAAHLLPVPYGVCALFLRRDDAYFENVIFIIHVSF